MNNKSFYIKSLGCKTNMVEGQLIYQELLKSGYEPARDEKSCDIFVLNTCSVTSHADNQAKYIIKQFRAKNPAATVILTGCLVHTESDNGKPDVDIILGNDEKLDICKFLENANNGINRIFAKNIFEIEKFHHKNLETLNTTRATIKIQEGCSNRCSYCVIPYARGNSRSDSAENIIEQINFLADKGCKEVVISGTHIGEWGKEFNKSLIDLLKKIEDTRILRYRLGSLYVTELDDTMIEFLHGSTKFCPHFHLSLQSLCDKTLKNMNRHYSKEYAIDVIHKLQQAFQLPFIGCDIITGFAGEDEKDFRETYTALNEAELSYIHSFPFSERKGTPAYNMPNKVYEHVRKERTKKLIELSNMLHDRFLAKNKNTVQEVLFQKKSKKNGKYIGLTRNYIKVYKESGENIWNTVENLNLSEYEIG